MINIKKDDENALQIRNGYKFDPNEQIWFDAIEETEEYKKIIKEVEQKVNELLLKEGLATLNGKEYIHQKGSCYRYWEIKKKVLKDNYNITWRSLHDANPFVLFTND